MPAGSVSKAATAASLRPSTSTMSVEGAPRAKEMGEGGGEGSGAVSGVSVVWGPVTALSLPYARRGPLRLSGPGGSRTDGGQERIPLVHGRAGPAPAGAERDLRGVDGAPVVEQHRVHAACHQSVEQFLGRAVRPQP